MIPSKPIQHFCDKVVASLNDGTFVRLHLSGAKDSRAPEKILGRVIQIRGETQLSLTLRWPTRDETKNLPLNGVPHWLEEQLMSGYRSALLGTTTRDWQLVAKNENGIRLIGHKPAQQAIPARTHDQKRAGLLDASATDWLAGLGVSDRAGNPRPSMADKFRQINHYLEIFGHLARECGWLDAERLKNPLHFVDMGCGKGYLTFGLWHMFHRVHQREICVTGIEAREDIVKTTNELARRIRATGLEFRCETIAASALREFDALIALHACDTATDDAIRRGIAAQTKLIVVAPCCQKELRPQLGKPEPLAGVLRHGIMAERMAEWATDGLRALFLEWAGYRTKLQEFIAGDHTPKNLMITAIREAAPFTDLSRRERIQALKQFLGVSHHALDPLLEMKP